FVLYSKTLRPQTLIVFIPVMSILLTQFFLLIRRKKFVVMNSWILFAGIVSVAYLARFDKIESVDYSTLLVQHDTGQYRGKRILVLGSEFDLYSDNYLATPFLNWSLVRPIFSNPDYYNNVTRVYRAFKNDPPELILDSNNLLERFFDRMPELRAQYLRDGDRYIRKVSN